MNESLQQFFNWVKRAPFLFFCIVLFVGLSAANYFLWKRQQEISAQHEDVRRNGESMFSALSSHTRLLGELATVDDALKQIDDNLIVETDLAENLGYFYQIETLTRVRLTQLNQLSSQPADESPFKAIPFSMRATGTYPQLVSFIRELETGPRQLRIKSFDFSRADTKVSPLALSLTVELLGKP